MNARHIVCLVGAVVGLTATPIAQQASPSGRKTSPKVQAKSVILTGCVTQGVDADHFVLANAVRRNEPPSATAIAGASKEVSSDQQGAADRTGPYDLSGGEFKAHLGHTVELHGTAGNTDTATSPTTAANTTERRSLPTFNVQSVKMLSETCS